MQEDLTDAVKTVLPEIRAVIPTATAVLARTIAPAPELLSMCKNPASCAYAKYYCATYSDIYKMANCPR